MNKDTFQFQNPQELAQLITELTDKSFQVVNEFLNLQDTAGEFDANAQDVQEAMNAFANQMIGQIGEGMESSTDPFNLSDAFFEFYNRVLENPEQLWNAQVDLWQDYANLWAHAIRRASGQESDPYIEAPRGDRRFRSELWHESFFFDYLKQAYLLTARNVEKFIDQTEGLDSKTQAKVKFFTQQFIDALSPSNFALTNPEVLQETLDTKGENLVRGLQNLLKDFDQETGRVKTRMTDMTAYKVGENIAVTPGKVIFRNKLIELIQYTPTTKEVHKTPLLIIPPWINKFYILDLIPANSFVKWAVDQGHTVFMISWRNPDASFKNYGFDEYMTEGPMAALDAIETATGEKEVNAIGYCIGGTLLGSMLAVYEEKKQRCPIKSATFFTTLMDFSEPGDLGVFIDEEQIENLEERMQRQGYLDGGEMAMTFNMLRSNDLIWSFIINNYLMGKDPFPFDLLYWNSDPTRQPAKLHADYLRNMYLYNKLVQPGGLKMLGAPIDLRKVKTPSFFISTREDHIAPWHSTYKGATLFSGPVTFCLAASGHIAGVVNHPDRDKYKFWMWDEDKGKSGDNGKGAGKNGNKSALPTDPEAWLAKAVETHGSWWPTWEKWLQTQSKETLPAARRQPGSGALPALGDAPGEYVKEKG